MTPPPPPPPPPPPKSRAPPPPPPPSGKPKGAPPPPPPPSGRPKGAPPPPPGPRASVAKRPTFAQKKPTGKMANVAAALAKKLANRNEGKTQRSGPTFDELLRKWAGRHSKSEIDSARSSVDDALAYVPKRDEKLAKTSKMLLTSVRTPNVAALQKKIINKNPMNPGLAIDAAAREMKTERAYLERLEPMLQHVKKYLASLGERAILPSDFPDQLQPEALTALRGATEDTQLTLRTMSAIDDYRKALKDYSEAFHQRLNDVPNAPRGRAAPRNSPGRAKREEANAAAAAKIVTRAAFGKILAANAARMSAERRAAAERKERNASANAKARAAASAARAEAEKKAKNTVREERAIMDKVARNEVNAAVASAERKVASATRRAASAGRRAAEVEARAKAKADERVRLAQRRAENAVKKEARKREYLARAERKKAEAREIAEKKALENRLARKRRASSSASSAAPMTSKRRIERAPRPRLTTVVRRRAYSPT